MPTYNHTREDSALTPCDTCRREAEQERAAHYARAYCTDVIRGKPTLFSPEGLHSVLCDAFLAGCASQLPEIQNRVDIAESVHCPAEFASERIQRDRIFHLEKLVHDAEQRCYEALQRNLDTASGSGLDALAAAAGVEPRASDEPDVELRERIRRGPPVPMILTCPGCGARHVDEGAFATKIHHTHACQTCGMVWRPAIVPTVGVKFLPGYGPAGDSG